MRREVFRSGYSVADGTQVELLRLWLVLSALPGRRWARPNEENIGFVGRFVGVGCLGKVAVAWRGERRLSQIQIRWELRNSLVGHHVLSLASPPARRPRNAACRPHGSISLLYIYAALPGDIGSTGFGIHHLSSPA